MVSSSCVGPRVARQARIWRGSRAPRGWLFVAEKADPRRPADWAAAGRGAARDFAVSRAPSFRPWRGPYGQQREATGGRGDAAMTTELIARARSGDGEAFRQLIGPHRRGVMGARYPIPRPPPG